MTSGSPTHAHTHTHTHTLHPPPPSSGPDQPIDFCAFPGQRQNENLLASGREDGRVCYLRSLLIMRQREPPSPGTTTAGPSPFFICSRISPYICPPLQSAKSTTRGTFHAEIKLGEIEGMFITCGKLGTVKKIYIYIKKVFVKAVFV